MLKIFSLSMLPRKQQSLLVTFVFLFNACTSDSSSTPDGAITETDAKPDGAITETDAISSDIINIANPGTLVVETDNLIPHFQSCLNFSIIQEGKDEPIPFIPLVSELSVSISNQEVIQFMADSPCPAGSVIGLKPGKAILSVTYQLNPITLTAQIPLEVLNLGLKMSLQPMTLQLGTEKEFSSDGANCSNTRCITFSVFDPKYPKSFDLVIDKFPHLKMINSLLSLETTDTAIATVEWSQTNTAYKVRGIKPGKTILKGSYGSSAGEAVNAETEITVSNTIATSKVNGFELYHSVTGDFVTGGLGKSLETNQCYQAIASVTHTDVDGISWNDKTSDVEWEASSTFKPDSTSQNTFCTPSSPSEVWLEGCLMGGCRKNHYPVFEKGDEGTLLINSIDNTVQLEDKPNQYQTSCPQITYSVQYQDGTVKDISDSPLLSLIEMPTWERMNDGIDIQQDKDLNGNPMVSEAGYACLKIYCDGSYEYTGPTTYLWPAEYGALKEDFEIIVHSPN